MNVKLKRLLILSGLLVSTGVLVTSCIREALPEIGVDVTGVESGSELLDLSGQGIIKTTVQESSVTLYSKSMDDLKNIDINVQVSDGATYSFVEVVRDSSRTDLGGGMTAFVPSQDSIYTTSITKISKPKDFTKVQYIMIVSEAEGLSEDDHKTQALIDAQTHNPNDPSYPTLMGWEKDGKLSRNYVEGAHLYKIWSIYALPAGIPTELNFDNWYKPADKYYHPYEIVNGVQSNIWSSTNASISLMEATNPLVQFGIAPTVSPSQSPDNNEMVLTSNDIRYTGTLQRPFLAGCCFIGEYDGSDNGALTCTHVGLPFNKAPRSLSFSYKYFPMTIGDPNEATELAFYRQVWRSTPKSGVFSVPDIQNYVGKKDKGFIRAVLYRADGDTKWLNGESIRLFPNIPSSLSTHAKKALENIVAYAEFDPEGTVSEYTTVDIPFTYVNGHTYDEISTSKDIVNWKYNLAIYFASSYDGFRFICGANMTAEYQEYVYYYTQLNSGAITLAEFNKKVGDLVTRSKNNMGTKLYIDNMKIKCE